MNGTDISSIPHTLQLDEDLKLHRTGKRTQYVGWTVWAIIVILAALGVFGNGVMSKVDIRGTNASIRYDRFLRYENELPVDIHTAGVNGEVQVAVPQAYAAHFKIQECDPMPISQQVKGSIAYYTFLADSNNTHIRVYFSPEKRGIVEGDIYVNGEAFHLKQFIYP